MRGRVGMGAYHMYITYVYIYRNMSDIYVYQITELVGETPWLAPVFPTPANQRAVLDSKHQAAMTHGVWAAHIQSGTVSTPCRIETQSQYMQARLMIVRLLIAHKQVNDMNSKSINSQPLEQPACQQISQPTKPTKLVFNRLDQQTTS